MPLTAEQEKARRCYYIPHIPNGVEMGRPGHYFPGVVVEGVSGYYLTDWDWGTDRALALKCAAEKNAALGLTPEDVERIVCSSMFAKGGAQ